MSTLEIEHSINVSRTESTLSTVEQLPHTQPITLRFWLKRVFFTVALCVLMFCLIEGMARFIVVQAHPPISHSAKFDHKFELAQWSPPKPKSVNITILGDSLIDFAVYSEQLAARLQNSGLRVMVQNLAVPSNSYAQDLLLLKAAVKAGNKPRVVIVNAHLRLFNRSFSEFQAKNTQRFEQSYLARCLTQDKLGWQPKLRCELEKNFYILRYRDFFKTELTTLPATLLNPKKRLKTPPYLAAELEFSPGGWSPAYSVYSDKDFLEKYKLSNPAQLKHIQHDFSHFQWTDAQFTQLNAYCQKEHIPLLVVWLPEHPISDSYYDHFKIPLNTITPQYERYFKAQGVPFFNLRNTLKKPEFFTDPEHFNPLGARLITEQIGDILLKDYATILQSPTESAKL